jgi:hypothetical protein
MNTSSKTNIAQCSCGKNQFTLTKKPLLRAICHCEICQKFNQAPFGDIVIFSKRDVLLPENHSVAFKTYTTPPMVQRGKCTACQQPAIELMEMPMTPALIMIPAANISNKDLIPEVSFHSFYHRRIKDVNDAIPKYSGYLKSQTMFMLNLFKAKLKQA